MVKKGIRKKTKRRRKYSLKFYLSWKEVITDILRYPKLNEGVKEGLEDAIEYVDRKIKDIQKQTRLFS